jgi:hypothetical protein
MKRIGIALALACTAGCKADLPELTDAKGGFDARCTVNADLVVDVLPTTLDGAPALGAPDAASVTLSPNGVLTVGFIGLGGIVDAPGIDLRIHGTVAAGAMGTVHIAGTDMQFKYSGDLTPTSNEIDLAVALTIPTAVYVRIIDVTGMISVDALEATHGTCP